MEKIFLSVLNMSLTGSFIIIAICLARLMLKKAPKVISYALWAVAGFRLMFPFTLEGVFSLLPFKSAPIPQDIATQAIPRIDSGITVVDNAVSMALPAAAPAASVNPLQVWIAIGSYIWLFGIAVMFIYSFMSIILLKRRLSGAVLIEGNLYQADNIKTPFVIGLIKPKIYIPTGLMCEEHCYIVLHEQTHILRYDHAVKMLAYLVLCLHWFNPLAWIAFTLMGADMEMSCDERVMKELGGDIKKAYSLSLVRVAAGRKILNGSPLAFGEGGMKERIKNVLDFRKSSKIIVIAAVAFVAVLSVGLAVNRTDKLEIASSDVPADGSPNVVHEGKSVQTIRSMMELDYASMTVAKFNETIQTMCADADTTVFEVISDAYDHYLVNSDSGEFIYFLFSDQSLESFMRTTLSYSAQEIFGEPVHLGNIMYMTMPNMTAMEVSQTREQMQPDAWERYFEENIADIRTFPVLSYEIEANIQDPGAIMVSERDSKINDIHAAIKEFWYGLDAEAAMAETLEDDILAEFERLSAMYSDDKMKVECRVQSIERDI